ncbi:hypothetical protein [Actinomadura roseirufa]|uniref:hypothetical protein n=1 Tax=Actinomadura roseirufa TaxID=2094049 RepID=UPI0013F16A5E|nr:hypothetical protein [Actinomadura roseirufa]
MPATMLGHGSSLVLVAERVLMLQGGGADVAAAVRRGAGARCRDGRPSGAVGR